MAYFLYKIFDEKEQLVYVGMTDNIPRRFIQHRNKEWFKLMTRFESYVFESEEECREAETNEILLSNPIYNKIHNKKNNDLSQRTLHISDSVMQRMNLVKIKTGESLSRIAEKILDENLPSFEELIDFKGKQNAS